MELKTDPITNCTLLKFKTSHVYITKCTNEDENQNLSQRDEATDLNYAQHSSCLENRKLYYSSEMLRNRRPMEKKNQMLRRMFHYLIFDIATIIISACFTVNVA